MGVTALACAAVDDVTAWCLLALVVGIVGAKMGSVLLIVTLTLAFIALMLFVVRRPVKWLCNKVDKEEGRISQGILAVILLGLLLSGLATEFIGIHAIFGAFLFGVIIPHDSRIARDLTDRLQDLIVVLLLPAFFAFTGMRTQIGLVDGLQNWIICIIIIIVASVGKFGGSLVAARMVGLSWREGSALGILMNTRGLMELIVLNIGLDLGVISPTLFAMLVIMALVTTFATTPILHLITQGWIAVAAPAKQRNNPAA
jgi:Kef-type K+ transport system membrane component KefB